MRSYRAMLAMGAVLLLAGCGASGVKPVKSKSCDGGNIEDCRVQCDQNVPRDCYRLGWFTERGQGVEQNSKKAIKLYEKACDANWAISCRALGIIYLRGELVARNKKKALKFYKKACGLGVVSACPKKKRKPGEPAPESSSTAEPEPAATAQPEAPAAP